MMAAKSCLVAIIGAVGNTGRAAVAELVGRGAPVRPIIRRPSTETIAVVSSRLNFGEKAAEILRPMVEHYNRHGLAGNANVLRMLIGREPTTIGAPFRQIHPTHA